jgi:hypothetical protein
LLFEKLATREALFDKGVISNHHERSWYFCYSNEESLHHLFLFSMYLEWFYLNCKGWVSLVLLIIQFYL